nr:hypothetical protein [Tanacetum cinerariifolium]
MRAGELHKFSDGMLNDVRSALHDIAAGIRLEYLPMMKWSNLDKKRDRVMIQDIDKQLYQRRLMRNLEKFVGGRPEPEGSTQDNPLDSVVVLRFNTSAGNHVKEILLKLNLPDHRSILTDLKIHIKMDIERRIIKVKELQERCIIKAFKLSYQEKYEHVGPKVTRSQEGKRSQDDDKRFCLVDDLNKFKFTFITS